jgi:hypothetical protein
MPGSDLPSPETIGFRDLYDKLVAQGEVLNEIRTMTAVQQIRLETLEREDQDQEARVRAIERRLYAIPSAAVVISLGSLIVAAWEKVSP